MRLPFLDRGRELTRLRRSFARPGGSLIVVYGRRRCGKSRLLQEALRGQKHAYYLADLSDASLQRHTLAVEAERVVPGFAAASYADWAALFDTWRRRAPEDAWLVLDELPYLVQVSPALPSIIQRIIDTPGERPLRLAACGSSQRMMHGLVLDETAPLYGRAAEVVKTTVRPRRRWRRSYSTATGCCTMSRRASCWTTCGAPFRPIRCSGSSAPDAIG